LATLLKADRAEVLSAQLYLTEAAEKTATAAADCGRLFVRMVEAAGLAVAGNGSQRALLVECPQHGRKQFNLQLDRAVRATE
jgi:hypothetical protein